MAVEGGAAPVDLLPHPSLGQGRTLEPPGRRARAVHPAGMSQVSEITQSCSTVVLFTVMTPYRDGMKEGQKRILKK